MNIQISTRNFKEVNTPVLVIAVFKDEKADSGILQELNTLTGGVVRSVFDGEELKGKDGETAFLHLAPNEKIKANRLLLIGVGDKAEYNAAKVAQLAGTAARFCRSKNIKSFALVPRTENTDAAQADETAQSVATGAILSLFELDKYRTKDKEERVIDGFTVVIENGDEATIKKGIKRGQIIGDSMNFTRDLANEPGNYLPPAEMASRAQKMAAEVGLKCEILDEADCEKLGMGSFLSVGAGSEQPSKFIVLRYEPASGNSGNKDLVALVGKGITFDTGGISLKPGENMDAMKYDMTGGGTVLGAMRAIALLKPNIPVLGIVAAAENMPDGKATKPGDIVTAMNGKTIEVLNTDAEGRLVLADAVAYAVKEGATHIVDMATLTGAVIIALGDVHTAILGTDQEWVDEIINSGKEMGERFWQLPLDKEYFELIKSPIADIKNIGTGRKAGTIVGAAFIAEFAEGAKWAHLDIAGTAWHDDAKPYRSKGPSGVAIRTLVNIVENRSKN
jgi:leucyl aminopeptidase